MPRSTPGAPPLDSSSPVLRERQAAIRRMLERIDLTPLHEIWFSHGGIEDDLESGILSVLYEICAERAIRKGEVFMAEDLAARGQKRAVAAGFDDLRCFQLQALALARSGAPRQAADLLLRLSKVAKDPESYGLLARTFRDLAWEETDPEERRALFREAHFYANESLERNPQSFYNAIQAAQFAFFAEDMDQTNIHLKTVDELCARAMEEARPAASQEPFWVEVTLAEAALLRGNDEVAARLYASVLEFEELYPADTEACRRVARQILQQRRDPSVPPGLLELLKPRPVMVFSGHMFDAGAGVQKLSIEVEAALVVAIDEAVRRIRPRVVFVSLSFGSDLLFVESALRFFQEERALAIASLPGFHDSSPPPVNLILAFDLARSKADFERRAEAASPPAPSKNGRTDAGSWVERFNRVISAIPLFQILEARFPESGDCSMAYAHANALLLGMARLKADESGADLVPLVVHNGTLGEPGGVGHFVRNLPTELAASLITLNPDHLQPRL